VTLLGGMQQHRNAADSPAMHHAVQRFGIAPDNLLAGKEEVPQRILT